MKCGDLDWSQAWLVSLGSRVLPLSEGHPTLCQQAKVWGPEATTRWRHNPADGLKASANTPPPTPRPRPRAGRRPWWRRDSAGAETPSLLKSAGPSWPRAVAGWPFRSKCPFLVPPHCSHLNRPGPLTTYTEPPQGSLTCFFPRAWGSHLWAFRRWSPPDSPGLAPRCPVC